MSAPREVRVTESFFVQLDLQLQRERGADGQPSSADFIAFDLPSIVTEFAGRFEELPEAIPGVTTVRTLIGVGALVPAYVVHGTETSDGIVELIGIELDV